VYSYSEKVGPCRLDGVPSIKTFRIIVKEHPSLDTYTTGIE